jgi:hypothetical protein
MVLAEVITWVIVSELIAHFITTFLTLTVALLSIFESFRATADLVLQPAGAVASPIPDLAGPISDLASAVTNSVAATSIRWPWALQRLGIPKPPSESNTQERIW